MWKLCVIHSSHLGSISFYKELLKSADFRRRHAYESFRFFLGRCLISPAGKQANRFTLLTLDLSSGLEIVNSSLAQHMLLWYPKSR